MTLVDHINAQLPHAINLTGCEEDAKDLIQDLAVKVFSNVDYFNSKASDEQGKIINTALKNLFIDQCRREKRKPKHFLYLDDSSEWWDTKEGLFNIAWVDNEFYVNHLRKKFYSSVASMKNQVWANAVRLFSEGYSYSEIAELYNISINTVCGYIKYGRRHLKQSAA